MQRSISRYWLPTMRVRPLSSSTTWKRPDQKDEDSLPPYPVLDAILDGLVEQELSVADLVAKGFDRATVKKVEQLLYISEYKRYQSAPGTRLTRRAFAGDRRYPIANRWRDNA